MILLATLDYPPRRGGVAAYLSRLAAQFPPGMIAVLAPEEDGTHPADMSAEVPVYRRTMLTGFLRPRWLPALYWTDAFVRRLKPSCLVVSHLLPMGTVARIIGRRRRVPYVVIVHGMDAALALHAGGRKRREAARVLGGATLIIANSGHTARMVASLGAPERKITVLRPSPSFSSDFAVSDEERRAVRARHGLGDDFMVMSAGRLVPRKGFDDAIRALEVLKSRGVEVKLLIVGDGPERPRLDRLAKELDVEGRVVFAGDVPADELPAYYAACDAFLMASKSIGPDVEGFGIVYLEAGACGKPSIGSRSGGVPEAVIDGQTGLLVDPGSAVGIADAIARLKTDPELARRLGEQGRERVRQEFGPDMARPVVEELLRL